MPSRSLSDAKPITLTNPKFWALLQEASEGKGVGLFKVELPSGGSLYLVNLDHSAKMVPFVRTQEELFETTLKRASSAEKFKVVINGPTYGLTYFGKVDALSGSDPVKAEETLQQG